MPAYLCAYFLVLILLDLQACMPMLFRDDARIKTQTNSSLVQYR